MIVVDTNVIAYASLIGDARGPARAVLARDRIWSAPVLWRSEFRNVLRQQMRSAQMARARAVACFDDACALVEGREHAVETDHVLALAEVTGCTTYDCEFVALALSLNRRLVTADRQILREFPGVAVSPEAFAAGG